jgi:signal transduction histidine kinase
VELVSILADFAWDVVERKRAEKKIIEQNQKEAILTQTIQTIQTDIARDLHDTLGQNIGYLLMKLAHLSETELPRQTDMQTEIQSMSKVASESYDLIRGMLAVFQAGNSTDPLYLFNRYTEQVIQRSSLQIDITSQGNPKQLSPHQIRQLFYIFREALSNIEKYAHAGQVSCEFVWNEHAMTFGVSDNGRGFDPQAVPATGHYGLKFMHERAEILMGSFSIQSEPGQGTKITVIVPYESSEHGSATHSQ